MNFKFLQQLQLLFLVLSTYAVSGQNIEEIYDGPYIDVLEDSLSVQWIEGGTLQQKMIGKDQEIEFDVPNLPYLSFEYKPEEYNKDFKFSEVSKVVALSDIHGQFDVAFNLLKQNAVIDEYGNWNYDDGHLVVVGDVMDRGPEVTATLWFLYQLDIQAKKSGGRVHMLLGNHELMVLQGNLKYIHKKYRYAMALAKRTLNDLYGPKSILGNWLRSRPVSVVINDIAFVHGGFSKDILENDLSIKKINEVFQNEIIDKNQIDIEQSDLHSLLYFDKGPLWYRGYANPSGFNETAADSLLQFFDVNHIVVGHTSMPRIVPVHENKIFLIDSSIKFGKKGELLICEADDFFKGTMSGEKLSLDRKEITDASSPFEYVYQFNDNDLTIILDTDIGYLLTKNRMKEEYQPSKLIAIHNFEFNREWDVELRTRGNMRKQACHLPPLKIDFAKETLDYLGFSTNDKLKLVLPCDEGSDYQQSLYKEHLVYQMYQLIDTFGFRTHLVNVILKDKGKTEYKLQGFFIEDDKDYANRTKCEIVETGVIVYDVLERVQFLKTMFFQYLIMNTDFGIINKHNLEMIFVNGEDKPRGIPYDFDYAGIVNQDYAVPSPKIPISNVREYYFRGKNVSHEEVSMMRDYFNGLESSFYNIVEEADYLTDKSKKAMKKDIEEFYKRLNDEAKWEKRFINPRKMRK